MIHGLDSTATHIFLPFILILPIDKMSAQLKALQRFLQSKSPTLTLAPNGSKSTATRGPTTYEKHMHHKLSLKRIVHLSTLLSDISSLVDNAINDLKNRQFEIPLSVEELEHLASLYSSFNTEVKDEADVLEFYRKTTAESCAQIAFFLALRISEGKGSEILRYTCEKTQRAHAIPDGIIQISRWPPTRARV